MIQTASSVPHPAFSCARVEVHQLPPSPSPPPFPRGHWLLLEIPSYLTPPPPFTSSPAFFFFHVLLSLDFLRLHLKTAVLPTLRTAKEKRFFFSWSHETQECPTIRR